MRGDVVSCNAACGFCADGVVYCLELRNGVGRSSVVGGWEVMGLRGGIVYCELVRTMDLCFPGLLFYNNFN